MPTQQVVIEAGKTAGQYWFDLWRYRELLVFLAWRDIAVHYKQTVIGIAWAVLRPLATVVVFTFVFRKLANLPADGDVPYPLFVLAGMLPWQMFATGLSESGNSLVMNANLIAKVYFPRLLVPLASVAVSLVDLLITLPFLFGLMAFHQCPLTWRFLFLPVFLAVGAAAAVAGGLWFSALNVRFRDVRYILPFVVQFGIYLSPVGFSSTLIPAAFRPWFALNPMVGVINGFRWAILGTPGLLDPSSFGLSLTVIALLLVSGFRYFRHTERTFADVI
jgi:lipopolysaccharide transport system permease protein